jgi:hypothetical protein
MRSDQPHPLSIAELGKPIWDNVYMVRVRYIDTLSIEMIKIRGVPTVADSGLDKDMHNQPITCCITINDMVEYFKRGVRVTLCHNPDSMLIYNIVNEYLLAWQHELDTGLNVATAPHEDLLLLDRFAQALYPQAAQFGNVKPRTNLVGSYFEKTGHVGRDSLMGIKATEATVITKKEHTSLADRFARSMAESQVPVAPRPNRQAGRNGWK